MRKTLTQTLLAAFCTILARGTFAAQMGGGGMSIAGHHSMMIKAASGGGPTVDIVGSDVVLTYRSGASKLKLLDSVTVWALVVGGGGCYNQPGESGGSGVVIIRFAVADLPNVKY